MYKGPPAVIRSYSFVTARTRNGRMGPNKKMGTGTYDPRPEDDPPEGGPDKNCFGTRSWGW